MGPDEDADTATVLHVAAELALARGVRMLEPAATELAAAERGVDHDRWFAAAVELKRQDLIALQTAEPSHVVLLAITNAGLQRHLKATRPDLPAVRRRVAQAAAAAAGLPAVALDEQVGEPPLLVECLLDHLVNQHRLTYSKAPGRRFRIHRVFSEAVGPRPESR